MSVNSDKQLTTSYPKCENLIDKSEDFRNILDLQKYHQVNITETLNHETATLETGISMVGENVIVLQNNKDNEIKFDGFSTELELNVVLCPKCRKIIENAKRQLDKVTVINKEDETRICDHCKKRVSTRESCTQRSKIVETFIKRSKEKEDDNKNRLNLWLSKVKHILKDIAPNKCQVNQKYRRAYSATDINETLDETRLLSDHSDFQKYLWKFDDASIYRKPSPHFTPRYLHEQELYNNLEDNKFLYKTKSTGKIYTTFHDHSLLKINNRSESFSKNKHLFEDKERTLKRKDSISHLLAVDLIPEIYDYVDSDKITYVKPSSQADKIFIKEKDITLQSYKMENNKYLNFTQGYPDYSKQAQVPLINANQYKPGFSNLRSDTNYVTDLGSEYLMKCEPRTTLSAKKMMKSHSVKNIPAMELISETGFNFSFPKLPEIGKPKLRISSSVLIKETQDILDTKAELDKRSLDKKRRKKLEDEEKKRTAFEEKNNLRQAKRKEKEEEQKIIAEEIREIEENKLRLQDEIKKHREELIKEKKYRLLQDKTELKITRSSTSNRPKPLVKNVKSISSKFKTDDLEVDKPNERNKKDESEYPNRELFHREKGGKERLKKDKEFQINKKKENKPKDKEKLQSERIATEEKLKLKDILIKHSENMIEKGELYVKSKVNREQIEKENLTNHRDFSKNKKEEHMIKEGKIKHVDKTVNKENNIKYTRKSFKDDKLNVKNDKLKIKDEDPKENEDKIMDNFGRRMDTEEKYLNEQDKDKKNDKLLKQQEYEKKAKEAAENRALHNEILALKRTKEIKLDKKLESVKEQSKSTKMQMELDYKDLNFSQIKVHRSSPDDLILDMVKLKQFTTKKLKEKAKDLSATAALDILKEHMNHKHDTASTCPLCISSDFELDIEEKCHGAEMVNDIIVGEKISKYRPSLYKEEDKLIVPILFESVFKEENVDDPAMQLHSIDASEPMKVKSKSLITNSIKDVEREPAKGIIRYALSDRTFIEKGWTMLPTEKVVRKMNVYRMRPAHPEFDWFEHNKNKKIMFYETEEKLAEFDDNGRGRLYYRNGNLALDYYDAEELNAQQRVVIYSSGKPDERGRTHPITILATFDYLGNGIVFDHAGKIRLKYNQTEGVVLDRAIGPASHWKWHTLNDPPVLQQVMIDTEMALKDPDILKLGGPSDNKPRSDNEEMLAIEFDNYIKEKSKKLTQSFKPFQIKMKALKINEHFSLKILDQATVYLIFRDGSANLKMNIGMILDHKEIVDTDTADLGDVSNSLERFPARTESLARLQRSVAYAQRFERTRTGRKRRLQPPEPCNSGDQLTTVISKPLRPPFHIAPSGSSVIRQEFLCKCNRRPSSSNLYYNTRFV